MTEEKNIQQKQTADDEIDLIEVALKIWAERKIIFRTVAVFFVLGLIIAFGSKEEYKSETTFILEDNQGGSRMSGMLAQFGGLAGINLGGAESGDILSPQLFPNIIHSTSFLVKLAREPIYFEKNDATYKLGEYFYEIDKPSLVSYIKGFTIGLPGKIIGLFKKKGEESVVFGEDLVVQMKNNDKPLKMSKTEQSILGNLSERISVNFDEETGILSLNTELPDPNAAAEVTRLALEDLRKYIIDYQTEKAQEDLQFIENQFVDAKHRFLRAQGKLASFRDENINVVTAKAQTEEQRLQAEYDLAFNVYNGLAQQYEQAKIKVQEKTPVFKVVNEARVPLEKSKPRKSLIMTVMVFIGIILSLGWVVLGMVWEIIIQKRINH